MEGLDRGEIVLAPDLYSGGKRPVMIVSDSEYPFYPSGYLGLPVTTQDRSNTYQIYEQHIEQTTEPLARTPSYVNPYSPLQVNDWEKRIVSLSETFVDDLVRRTAHALGAERNP